MIQFNPVSPVERAKLLDFENPDWMILWSSWNEAYVAFPKWPGHSGGHIIAKTDAELTRLMDQMREAARLVEWPVP